MLKTLTRKITGRVRQSRRDYVTNTLKAITGHHVVLATTRTGHEAFLLQDAIDVAQSDAIGCTRPIDVTLDAVAFTNEVLLDHMDANHIVAQAIHANTEYAAEALRLATA